MVRSRSVASVVDRASPSRPGARGFWLGLGPPEVPPVAARARRGPGAELGGGGVGAAGPLAFAEDDAEGGDGLGVGGVLAADGGEAAGGVRGGADETAESGKAEGFHLLDVAGDLLGALALVRGEPLRRGRERWMEEG